MASLSRLFQKYTGFLRSLKASYVINNVLNRNRLLHNKVLYPKYGLKKSIYSPIGSHDFSSPSPERPWLDTPNAWSGWRHTPDTTPSLPTPKRKSAASSIRVTLS
jgi:hypothetical protein